MEIIFWIFQIYLKNIYLEENIILLNISIDNGFRG